MKRSKRLWRRYIVVESQGYITTFRVNQLGVGTMSSVPSTPGALDEIRRAVPYATITSDVIGSDFPDFIRATAPAARDRPVGGDL